MKLHRFTGDVAIGGSHEVVLHVCYPKPEGSITEMTTANRREIGICLTTANNEVPVSRFYSRSHCIPSSLSHQSVVF